MVRYTYPARPRRTSECAMRVIEVRGPRLSSALSARQNPSLSQEFISGRNRMRLMPGSCSTSRVYSVLVVVVEFGRYFRPEMARTARWVSRLGHGKLRGAIRTISVLSCTAPTSCSARWAAGHASLSESSWVRHPADVHPGGPAPRRPARSGNSEISVTLMRSSQGGWPRVPLIAGDGRSAVCNTR